MDERLLDRVGAALATRMDLAKRVASGRKGGDAPLRREGMLLSGRIRRQSELLRARITERKALLLELEEVQARAEEALARADLEWDRGERWELSARLPRDPTCSRVARRLLEEYARAALTEDEGADAMLIVSELVTNALRHGAGTIVLSVTRAEDRLRIEVTDEGHPAEIQVVPEEARRENGRGLWIVDQLASKWGAVSGTGRVWAELTPLT